MEFQCAFLVTNSVYRFTVKVSTQRMYLFIAKVENNKMEVTTAVTGNPDLGAQF